jgi:hypothetical protein
MPHWSRHVVRDRDDAAAGVRVREDSPIDSQEVGGSGVDLFSVAVPAAGHTAAPNGPAVE